MRLSELSTEKASDVLCELAPMIANITGDAELMGALSQKIGQGASVAEIYAHGAKIAAALVPIVLKTHRTDLFGILAIMNECSAQDIGEQNIIKTMEQVQDLFNDRDLVNFFKALQQPGKTE